MYFPKKLLCVISLVFLAKTAYSQVSADCRFVVPICADTPTLGATNGGGDVEDFDPTVIRQSGCLEKGSLDDANIEQNSAWFIFRAGTDGLLGFDIEALSTTAEWDFAVYGPDVSCGDLGEPIRCNYETDNTAFTGIGTHPSPGNASPGDDNYPYDDWLEVETGETYYIFINNFNTNTNGDPEPFQLTFTGTTVNSDPQNALDCSIKNEFLGPDINLCSGEGPVILSAVNSGGGATGTSYEWFRDGILLGETGETLTINSPDSGTYSVIVTTATSTFEDMGIVVTFHDPPIIDEILVTQDISESNSITIMILGNSDYEYQLNGGDFQDSPDFTNVPPGLNSIIVNDKNGCGTTPQDILVVGYPKFFTPNRDGVYDTWHILGIETLTSGKVFIFDRYGKLLKQLDRLTGGWDGTFNGRPLPSSDYWFRFEYSRQEEGVLVAKSIRSHFTLKR